MNIGGKIRELRKTAGMIEVLDNPRFANAAGHIREEMAALGE